MSIFNSKDKTAQNKITEFNNILDDYKISKSLDVNVMAIKKLFEDDDTLITKSIVNNHDTSLQYFIAYCEGVADSFMINENIIKPLTLSNKDISKKNTLDSIIDQILLISDVKKISTMHEVIENITYGHTVLFIDKVDRALILNTKGFETRAITEPETEKTLSGPKEGFNECIITNLSLIHRKLRTNDLKIKYINLGKRSNTQICVCYMDSLVNKKILEELYSRLNKIKLDGVLDINYVNELIKDAPFSLFRTTGSTEKPDVVTAKLLEGRIALLVDGSPTVMTIPYLFIENFQSSEDYYLNYFYTSFTRMLRLLGFALTIIVPAFFICVVAFHQEMLPTTLFINIAMERQSSPLPAALEAFVLLILLDILKETGIRMPSSIGQTLSIVGALVIGQAAVEAKLVAAPMIIVVATTAITGLLIPKMNAPAILIRYLFLFLASMFGFYGLILGISWLIIHLLSLRSFGVPQLISSGNLKYQNIKDSAIRAPWWQMILRPRMISSDRKRMKYEKKEKDN